MSFDYHSIVHAIRHYNRCRIEYVLDRDNKVKKRNHRRSRAVMQGILSRYHTLTPMSRDAVDICVDVWTAAGSFLSSL